MKNRYLAWDAFNNGFVVAAKALQLLKNQENIIIDEIIYLHNKDLTTQNKAEIAIFFNKKQLVDALKDKSLNQERIKECFGLSSAFLNKPSIRLEKRTIVSVTDYQSIYNTLIKLLENDINDFDNLHINVSSGTPQMHVVWLMLNASGFLPNNTKLWSTQFVKATKKVILKEIKFSPKTYLSKILESSISANYKIKINPNKTLSSKRKKAENLIKLYAHIPNAPILLLGERGTGKSTYARTLINQSNKPFHELAVGTFNEELIRSELFGYKKGAFTGADQDKKGVLDDFKNGGILFLDEIQDLSKPLQRQLVQVLQTGVFYPLGSTEPKKAIFKLVTASNNTFKELVGKKLDLDFFDRIARFIVEIPPVRLCKEDFENYWKKAWDEIANFSEAPSIIWNKQINFFLEKDKLTGNFRDFQKLISYIIAYKIDKKSDREAINLAFKEYKKWNYLTQKKNIKKGYFKNDKTYREIINRFNKDLTIWAINKYGNVKKAAEILQKGESTLLEYRRGGKKRNL